MKLPQRQITITMDCFDTADVLRFLKSLNEKDFKTSSQKQFATVSATIRTEHFEIKEGRLEYVNGIECLVISSRMND